MDLSYSKVRYAVFKQELKLCAEQLKSIVVLGVIFLGTALPFIFYLLLLAFGIVFANESPSLIETGMSQAQSLRQMLILVWAILAFQSIVLLLCKPAILGSRYTLYLNSFNTFKTTKLAHDFIFTMFCAPCVVICLLVVLKIDIEHWSNIPHVWLFVALLLIMVRVAVYSLLTLQLSLLFLLVATFVMPTILGLHAELSWMLLIYISLVISTELIVQLIVKKTKKSESKHGISNIGLPVSATDLTINNKLYRLSNLLLFWLSIASKGWGITPNLSHEDDLLESDTNVFFILLVIIALVVLMTVYSATNLPYYSLEVYLIGMHVCLLFTCSLQLGVSKVLKEHPLFFNQIISESQPMYCQYYMSAILSLSTVMLFVYLSQSWVMLIGCLAAVVCLFTASTKSQLFIFTWAITSVLLSYSGAVLLG